MEIKKMENGRVDSIDIFRGIGIIIMVMGHVGFGSVFDHFIHAFHMPMFYFISGMFFKTEMVEKISIIDYAKKKAGTLLMPYFFFGIFLYIIWLKWNWTNEEADLYAPLVHLLGQNTWGGVQISSALWFLTSLFFTEMIYFVMVKIIKSRVVFHTLIAVLALAGNLEMKILPNQLPLALGPALVGVGLFDIAQILFTKRNTMFVKRLVNMSVIMLIILSLITTGLIFLNDCVSMRTSEYANILLFWINSVSSIIIGINISLWLDKRLPKRIKDIFIFIGKNSIVYVCLNQLVIAYIYPYADSYKFLELTITLIILGICSCMIDHTFLRRIIGRKG